MTMQQDINYKRIEKAIEYIKANFKQQPSLAEIANHVHLSQFHFQRLFTEWAGTTPKNFLKYISIEYCKHLLKEKQITLFDTTDEIGLSSTSRLHDLFIHIEGMTPAEYKNGGEGLNINYSLAVSPFGNVIIASTIKGICYMAFEDDELIALQNLKSHFPNATFSNKCDILQQKALMIFQNDWCKLDDIKLHLKGTDFQLKVWNALLNIPLGRLSTYGYIAKKINQPNASRAVGTAIGSNPIAYLIPCHRVIQSSGITGGYMWKPVRKTAIIGWEVAKCDVE